MSKRETISGLLEHAVIAFAEKGYNGASLRSIANSAQLPLAAIHNYFGSKEELFLAVVQKCFTALNDDRKVQLEEAQRRPQPLLQDFIGAIIDPIARRWAPGADADRYFVLLVRQLGGLPGHLLAKIQLSYLDDTASAFAQAIHRLSPSMSFERALHCTAMSLS